MLWSGADGKGLHNQMVPIPPLQRSSRLLTCNLVATNSAAYVPIFWRNCTSFILVVLLFFLFPDISRRTLIDVCHWLCRLSDSGQCQNLKTTLMISCWSWRARMMTTTTGTETETETASAAKRRRQPGCRMGVVQRQVPLRRNGKRSTFPLFPVDLVQLYSALGLTLDFLAQIWRAKMALETSCQIHTLMRESIRTRRISKS